ncbi:competence protein ComFC [Enterococcus sp. DIV1094]|uniref:Competence protein ComFC n=2 Tax=Candidatus Enterococcus mangumiae TaxID=2230878 RepID=A0ABZ2SS43_9ENTE
MMKCVYCKKPSIRNLQLSELLGLAKIPRCCAACHSLFQRIQQEDNRHCQGCQKGVSNLDIAQSRYCQDCLTWIARYPNYAFCHRAFFHYDKAFQAWLKQYKFMGDIQLAQTFIVELQELRKRYKSFIFCPIPLSEERIKERGFNQVSEMLKAAGLPFQELLLREKHQTPQAKKTREQRLATPQPFVYQEDKNKIEGKNILLIDDVYTTGQTMFHAASCLFPQSPNKVQTFSLAR